jgi:hypothetical protein
MLCMGEDGDEEEEEEEDDDDEEEEDSSCNFLLTAYNLTKWVLIK